jgi:dihydrofolate synthase / folylpolyglutamate synthase
VSSPEYRRLVGELFPRLSGGIRWGLDRTRRLLASVGDPHHAYATVHIAGTNGKGSAAATLASILRASGHRVGLYTSPHISDFRERFRVDGEPISESAVLSAAGRLRPLLEAESPSFFEATTAIGFLAFADLGVDIAVVEVGLGGRLDSTNVIAPVACAITNISLDHMQYLGDSVAAIAAEKAGIAKRGVPLVTTERGESALEVIRACAVAAGAPLVELDPAALREVTTSLAGTRFVQQTGAWGELQLATPLIGGHQAANTALAVGLAECLPAPWRPARDAVIEGVRVVRWPGRLQLESVGGVPWLFDVAHNAAGVAALTAALSTLELPRPLWAVVAVLADKDWRGMLAPLAGVVDRLIVTTAPSAPPDRRWDANAVAAELGARAEPVPRLEDALDLCGAGVCADRAGGASGIASQSHAIPGSVLVTGSFHTVGDALRMLGREP